MFVAINNIDMDIFKIDEWINRTRDASEDKLVSPEFAMELLSKTNFHGNIKKVLKNIREKCTTKEELLPYKEFVLSCVDRREMSDMVMASLCEIAKVCGCEEELNKINAKPKAYNSKDVKGRVVCDIFEFKTAPSDGIPVFIDLSNARDRVHFSDDDFSNVVGIKGKEGSELDFRRIFNFRKNLIVEGSCRAHFKHCDFLDLSGRLDLIGCRSLRISSCENLPDDIDASNCKVVNFYAIDMSKFDKVKFGDDVDLTFDCFENMPEKLDLSFACDVGFVAVDLSKVKELKFRDGANVECASQIFNSGDVDTVLPEYIDFSNCGKVKLQGATTSLKQVRFRDRAQGGDWAKTYESFYRGENKVVYAEDEKAKNIMLFNGGMDM